MPRITLRPESPVTETVASLDLTNNLLAAKLAEKREDFRQIVKFQCDMDFDWDRRQWCRKLNIFTGEPKHRIVELAHRLLAANFIIEIDAELVEDIQQANYEPEQTRWIKRVVTGEYLDWFSITWGRNDDYYDVAKKLPGSRYDGTSRCIVVPSVQFEAIQDFAQQRGFDLSSGAQELIKIAKAKRDEAILIAVAKPASRKKVVAKDVRPALVAIEQIEVADEFADDLT